ncbi:hypothetical protein BV20DRAFT_551379 [Pilatotrama ljubarskyi]|nr:hypothetical protein BV20DRAFT_551379 [Pilatotrama ljubarskyi]
MAPTEKLDFPQELLIVIKEHPPSWDLRSHVCFYLSSSRVAALYDSTDDPDAFWQLLCWENGIGAGIVKHENIDPALRPHIVSAVPGLSWKEIAIDCISRDGFCKHPQCGETLLEYNRQRMREAAEHVEPLKPRRLGMNDGDYVPLEIHQLLGHIEFKRYSDMFRGDPVELDAHLRDPDAPLRAVDDIQYYQLGEDYTGLYLARHPLAARSFATSTPVSNMILLRLGGLRLTEAIMERGGRAIIVFDVVKAVHRELDRYLTVDNACEYVSMHERCFPKDWTYKDAFSTTRHLRSILAVCPIETLEYEENTEYGPAFAFRQH